ncbi:hypothetical protein BC792_12432 [Sphingobacterium allocomposti]|uniref:Uncharacterized protein n=1 Tax=Sphingobacterium allocomposti TaxID=415956 RepID=A0A5S5D2R7_9SPHI|nr:hypothetical protein BC792_12432 [Sphingobacterium composti Yoo et al. 2007 non Ten et al. 2007]
MMLMLPHVGASILEYSKPSWFASLTLLEI